MSKQITVYDILSHEHQAQFRSLLPCHQVIYEDYAIHMVTHQEEPLSPYKWAVAEGYGEKYK